MSASPRQTVSAADLDLFCWLARDSCRAYHPRPLHRRPGDRPRCGAGAEGGRPRGQDLLFSAHDLAADARRSPGGAGCTVLCPLLSVPVAQLARPFRVGMPCRWRRWLFALQPFIAVHERRGRRIPGRVSDCASGDFENALRQGRHVESDSR